MPTSTVRTFTDPDQYSQSIRGGVVEFTVAERGDFTAKLIRIDLHCLWMQRFHDSLARIAEISGLQRERAYITFLSRPGRSLRQDGVEIDPSAILRYGSAPDHYQHSLGPTQFATMSLPVDVIAAIGEAMTGADLTPPRDSTLITPSPGGLDRLQRLHAAAGHLAEHAPEVIANPDAARGLEQALIEAMVDCLSHRQAHEHRAAQGQHAIVMRRFRRVIEENPEQPLFMPEICRAIRVSHRTLWECCQEHLGMSPKRYLLLRRMRLARRALLAAAPEATTVTEIASRYGYWQLGRFAVEYRSLFGETPSATLRRRPE